jgi:uncharacterized membrane protein required for colicin V production
LAGILSAKNGAIVGFIIVFGLFWLLAKALSQFASQKATDFGLGSADKILGFTFSSLKIFFILSVIFYTLSTIEVISKKLKDRIGDSFMYGILVDTGSGLMKIDINAIKQKVESNITKEMDNK